jgi:hypothetical protein
MWGLRGLRGMWAVPETALFGIFLLFLSLCLEEVVFEEVLGVEETTEFLHECDFLLAEFEDLLGDIVLQCEETWCLDFQCGSSGD